jgi:hypothetical protein
MSVRRGPATAVLALALLAAAACREPPARGMRRVQGVNLEIRAIGLPRPPEAALEAAFAGVTQMDGASVDRAVAVLRAAGAGKGLVNLGGDRVAVFGEPLVVAVPDPADATRPRWASLSLSGAALVRARGDVPGRAVTVVGPSAASAEALARSALSLPPDQAVELLASRGASGFVQTLDGAQRSIVTTSGFAAAHDLRAEAGVEVRP